MSSQRYTPEFKDEAVRQILERGHSVAEVSDRLGVSSHSLYKWVNAVKPDKTEQHAAELVEAKKMRKGLEEKVASGEEVVKAAEEEALERRGLETEAGSCTCVYTLCRNAARANTD